MTAPLNIQYAIQITTDDGTGSVIGSTDKSIGLIAGVFYMITGQPGYTGLGGAPVPVSGTAQTQWIEGLIDRESLGDMTLEIQLDTPNFYGSASDFEFTLRNAASTAGFFQRAAALGIKFTGRRIKAFVVIDGVFSQTWTGIIQADPFTDNDYKFSCMDDFISLHKDFPSGIEISDRAPTFNNLEFPNINSELKGKFIPISLGAVAYASSIDTEYSVPVTGHQGVILGRSSFNDDPTNNGSGNDYVDVAKVYHYLYSVDGETITSQLRLHTPYMDSATSTDINYKFQVNDTRLLGKYVYFIRGSTSHACRIIGNLLTTDTGTDCNTYLLLEERVTPIEGEGDYAGEPTSTYVQVLEKINKYIVSRNPISSFNEIYDVTETPIDVGYKVVSDSGLETKVITDPLFVSTSKKEFLDISKVCSDFNTDGNAVGDTDPITLADVTSTERPFFNITPIHLKQDGSVNVYNYFNLNEQTDGGSFIKFLAVQQVEHTTEKNIEHVKYEDGTDVTTGDDVSDRMTDGDHGTYIEAKVINQTPTGDTFGCLFTFEIHLPDLGEADITPLYVSFDASFVSATYTDDGYMKIFTAAYGADAFNNASNYFVGTPDISETAHYAWVKDPVAANTTYNIKMIPGDYYGTTGADGHFQGKKVMFDISSYIKNNKDVRVWRRLYLDIEFVMATVAAPFLCRVDQIALFSEPTINSESSKVWTRLQGEKADSTWDGRLSVGDPVYGPPRIVEQIMRKYDQIDGSRIDVDSFDAVHTNKGKLVIGKQIDDTSSSFNIIKDILIQTMTAITPTTDGRRRMHDFLNLSYATHTHDSTNIIKDSIVGLQKTSLGDVYNQFAFEYGFDPLNNLPSQKLIVQRLDQANFPASSSSVYSSGISEWKTFSYGFESFSNAGNFWQACKDSIKNTLVNRSVVAPDNIVKLTWFPDCKYLGLIAEDAADSYKPAYLIAKEHITWWTTQKYVIPYSLGMTADNLAIELLDNVDFTDSVIDPGTYAKAWITKKTIKPSKDEISVETMFYPGSYPSL